ncbi:hypothetical protein ACFL1B_06520, partial [Nanoarchaeota archaeon]
RELAARVTLVDEYGNEVKTAYVQRRWFDIWSPMAKAGIFGSGSAEITEHKYPVAYVNGNNMLNGMVIIQVVTPNR